MPISKNNFIQLFFIIIFIISALLFIIPIYAADSWPADGGSMIANTLTLGSGGDYEPSGLAYQSRLNKLVLVGDDGDITTLDTDGFNVDTWSGTTDDLEGVAITDPATDYVYVGVENTLADPNNRIKSFNLNTKAYAEKEWNLTPWMTNYSGSGLEALTFVPNGVHPYHDHNSTSGGLFYAGLQYDGKIYVFDINLAVSGSVTWVATITVDPLLTDISGLDYNNETGLIYAIFDTANELIEINPNGTIRNRYNLPGDTQEGVAVTSSCPSASGHVYVAEDAGEVWSYGGYPVICPGDNEGNNGGNENNDNNDNNGENGNDNLDNNDNRENSDNGQDNEGENSGNEGNVENENNEQGPEEYLSKNTIITIPGPGSLSYLRGFDRFGKLLSEFSAYENKNLKTGFNIASGDLNGDKKDEIVVAPKKGGGPQVFVFDHSGNKIAPGFFAYSKNIRCGVDVATGDLNNDGKEEIITIPGEGCPAHVRTFDYLGKPVLNSGFYAYNTKVISGFRISSGDLNNDSKDEIITSPEKGVPAHIRIFNYKGQPQFTSGFYAYNQNLKTGADVAAGDLNNDGKEEIITIPGDDYPSQIRIFNYLGNEVLHPGFYAYSTNVKTGFNISSGDLNNDHKAEIIVSPKAGARAHIRVLNYKGESQFTPGFYAYGQGLNFGADVALGKF